jgi:hypothetical protein
VWPDSRPSVGTSRRDLPASSAAGYSLRSEVEPKTACLKNSRRYSAVYNVTSMSTLSGSKAGISTTGVLLQRDASQADDEMRQSPVCLPQGPAKRQGPYFEWTYKAKRQNRQCETRSRSDAHVAGLAIT